MDSIFKNRTLMITGGTGSFGHAVLKHFLNSDLKQITSFPGMKRNKTICVMSFRLNIRNTQIK